MAQTPKSSKFIPNSRAKLITSYYFFYTRENILYLYYFISFIFTTYFSLLPTFPRDPPSHMTANPKKHRRSKNETYIGIRKRACDMICEYVVDR